MRQDDRRQRNSRTEGSSRTRGEGQRRSIQQSRNGERYQSPAGMERKAGQQGGSPQRKSEQERQEQRRTQGKQPYSRRPAAGLWPDRLEVEQKRAQERREQERRRRLKLQKKRRAKIRRFIALFTAALFGVALFLAVKLVKNWTAEPKGKEKEKEIDIEKLAEEEEYPESLLKLLEKNPETKDFVMNYPKNKDKHVDIDVSKEVTQGKIPLFLQWDERWGYETYGDDFLALTGCGPTCLSMVRCGLSGDSAWNPYKTARMAENGGYYVSGSGSSWDLMTQGAAELGLTYEEVIFDEEHIKATLEAGTPIICVVGPGDFTDNGHFLVLTGVDGKGNIILNDPNSKLRSKETWDINQLMNQIKNLWAYSYQGTEGEQNE